MLPAHLNESTTQFPLFHVLVVGAHESGKTCLVNQILGPNRNSQSSSRDGWETVPGLSSFRSPQFALHELGYVKIPEEDGLREGIAKLHTFCETNKKQMFLNQIHAIWFCVQIPFKESRSAWTQAELDFLRSPPTNAPIIPVFMRFDNLVSQLEEELSLPDNSSDDAAEQLTLQRAHVKFEESCVTDLTRISPTIPYFQTSGLHLNEDALPVDSQRTLDNLIQLTRDLTQTYVEGVQQSSPEARTLRFATAQSGRVESITRAMNAYRSILFSTLLPLCAGTPESRFDKLHRALTRGWKLDDPHRRNSPLLVSAVREMASVPTDASKSTEGYRATLPAFLDRYQLFIGLFLGGSISVTIGHAVALAVVIAWGMLVLVRWRYRIPETTRSFLKYTIHLILILDRIFHKASTARPLHPLTEDDMRRVLDEYRGSEAAAQVDIEVQLFLDDTCDSAQKMYGGLGKPRVEELVRELVRQWRITEDAAREHREGERGIVLEECR